ncbi:MAG: hypothetical protein GY865_04115 [candidate division Zixibacteria bacterium]|nr:hypothetical protein [candidate division Zixibacteria bacterium]
MKKILLGFAILFILVSLILILGCDKERTITSTEYIEKIEYIEKPADTVLVYDTLYTIDTLYQYDTTHTGTGGTDTITVIDTIYNNSTDTLTITEYIFDTVTITNTVYDTVTNTVNHYDTTTISQCDPFLQFAHSAMQYYGTADILELVNSEFGYADGWVYYLGITQCDVQSPSAGVYEIYGYANFWSVEFDAYYPLEYFWRMTHISGDPDDPDNWELSDPPARSSSKTGGVKLSIEHDISTVGTTIQNK